jgi:hypothetical protein
MNQWRKGIASWRVGDNLYISVPFTWLMEEALTLASNNKHLKAVIGGPGTMQPSICEGYEPVLFHNPLATITSRGCPNKCPWCAVPILEGDFRELESWRYAPIIYDNNLLASSKSHFRKVIDSLSWFPSCDFNQGLDARLFTHFHAEEIARLKSPHIRFAFDKWSMEEKVYKAVNICKGYGFKINVYCLIGHKDTPDDARGRLELVRSWGFRPNPARYQPLDAVKKNNYVADGWTEKDLRKMVKYYSMLRWFEHIPYDDFDYLKYDKNQGVLI